ncbi:hypothetical protein CFIMG_007986RA00001 [Ceratocystis fimbriata CBS 114723]|uniref:Uncharacterized protein n=1 Tax=Ceratocystis fimbriata CBS 114723 TaxID=1035309 RepID=A0A2C5WRA6_9PEZI|nr:hypothetical protein CFIMG_007986RA00001 [Ceratocystis fimbriata CBS 114723]
MLDPEDDLMVHPLINEDPDTEMQPALTETPEVPLIDTEEEAKGTVMSEETAQRLEELSSQKAGKRHMHKEPIKSTKVLKKACVMLAGLDQSRSKEHIPVPRTYQDAVNDPDWGEMWMESIKAELMALITNNT